MKRDAWGLPVSTASCAAVAAYDRGIHAFLGWDGRAIGLLEAAAAEDPGLAVVHADLAACLFLDERFAEARAAAARAQAAVEGQSDRERSHVAALAAFVGAVRTDPEPLLREHLVTWPEDMVILQRLYFLWFWQGRFPEMLALTTELLPHHEGRPFMRGLHAFTLEEAGQCEAAMHTAEAALADDACDAWAVHALAHGLYESARFDAGITRLPPAIHPCTHLGWFRHHLLWHLALLHLAQGNYARASTLSRRVFEAAPSSVPGDLHDSISLLWRLDLSGHPAGERWQPFAAIARARLDRQGLLFHAAHLAMALAAGGDWDTAERQLGGLRARAEKDRSGLVGGLVVPLVEGLQSFAAGDYQRTVERIEPIRARVVHLGGSRAQRDVFHDTLLEACFRAGDMERAERLLAERVLRRPDALWAGRQGAPVPGGG